MLNVCFGRSERDGGGHVSGRFGGVMPCLAMATRRNGGHERSRGPGARLGCLGREEVGFDCAAEKDMEVVLAWDERA